MADLAGPLEGARVLEPSAGTGVLLGALGGQPETVHAVEMDSRLADHLRQKFPLTTVHCRDFLDLTPDTFEPFDAVLMNPPFAGAADVAHILHARRFLAPAGRLVAICAGGPRQAAALRHLCEHWEPLPPGTFASQGTGINTVLLVMTRNPEKTP